MVESTNDERPELATNPEWREDMRRARKAKGWDQAQLATKVGTKQPQISDIESGEVKSSTFVRPISVVLGIAPPSHLLAPEQQKWSRLGHRLQDLDADAFIKAMVVVEGAIAHAELQQTQGADTATERVIPPPTRRARASANTNVTLPSRGGRPLRRGDELPFERAPKKK